MNKTIKIEIEEIIDIKKIFKDYHKIKIENSQNVQLNQYDLKGLKIGKSILKDDENQLNIQVVEKHTLSANFEISYERFSNKNVLVIGDSVSAQATIGNDKTYSTLLSEALNFNTLHNCAIGGTTLTYMYETSNIYKEYHDNLNIKDGCMMIKELKENQKLANIDYVFIAYGHNDQYFKVAIDEENTTNINSLSQIHSFKNSYRYIINELKKANPNIRIIILNCTYSEYDIASKSPYGTQFTYQDYRNASQQIAKEYQLKYIDPWEYMKQFCDYKTNNHYYKDSVHISKNGHYELFKFLLQQ